MSEIENFPLYLNLFACVLVFGGGVPRVAEITDFLSIFFLFLFNNEIVRSGNV